MPSAKQVRGGYITKVRPGLGSIFHEDNIQKKQGLSNVKHVTASGDQILFPLCLGLVSSMLKGAPQPPQGTALVNRGFWAHILSGGHFNAGTASIPSVGGKFLGDKKTPEVLTSVGWNMLMNNNVNSELQLISFVFFYSLYSFRFNL